MPRQKVQHNRTVIDHLENDPKPFVSFEIIPPKRGAGIDTLKRIVAELASYNPPFIDVTSHSSEAIDEENENGILVRKIIRKSPGTDAICTVIQHKYEIDAVPHVLCHGFTREETEDFLIGLSYSEIRNVLAIRGDEKDFVKEIKPGRSVNKYASDLVAQIRDMNRGKYLDEKLKNQKATDFCIGVAGYPEEHFQAPNLTWELRRLKEKVEAGASYIVTQMFFENSKYYSYVEKCREAGIQVPIIPGLKILDAKGQLTKIPEKFRAKIPVALTDEIEKAKDEEVENIGVEWVYEQVRDLYSHGVPSVHLYVMQKTSPVNKLMQKLECMLA